MVYKRMIDLLFSSLLLLLLSPLFLLIALTIWLTSGRPVFFRQPRLGKDGLPFDIYKFRTMQVAAPDIRNPDGSTYNAEDDPRLTPLGSFLRRASLDELPQLFNVLVGEMSIVGPRPEVVDVLPDYKEVELIRLSMKPGITGWAAVRGRNSIPLGARRQFDIDYVTKWSLWLDFKIILLTIPAVLYPRDIYSDDESANYER